MKEATQAARAVPGMDAVTEQDIIQLVGGEQEQTIEEMLDVGDEREKEVLQELPQKKEPSTKSLSLSLMCGFPRQRYRKPGRNEHSTL